MPGNCKVSPKFRNEELFIDGIIDKARFTELKNKLEIKNEELKKEFSKEHEILKSEIFKESAEKGLAEVVEHLQEQIQYFFDTASYEELKELVNIVVDKIIVPKDKEEAIQIILRIPGNTLSFNEKYSEQEYVEYEDEQGKTHNIHPLPSFTPKKLELDPTKKPYKYRSVAFKEDMDDNKDSKDNDDNDDNNSNNGGGGAGSSIYENYEGKFLDFLKERFYQFCGCDHL